MDCPFCHTANTKVIDSRLSENSVRRRRRCDNCDKRFTTFEKVELNFPLVVKNDGRREPYVRDKILTGIGKACQKRPISLDQIEAIIDNVERSIIEMGQNEINSKEIGRLIMDHLEVLDPVAYVRFASVYRTFQDVDEFVKNLVPDEESRETRA